MVWHETVPIAGYQKQRSQKAEQTAQGSATDPRGPGLSKLIFYLPDVLALLTMRAS